MFGLILLLAIAYACACAIDNATTEVSKKHKKRIAKASKKKGRSTGAKAAAWAATGATAAGTFLKGFWQGFKREWPKAKKRAADKVKTAKPTPATETKPVPAAPKADPVEAAVPEKTSAPTLVLVKDTPDTTTTTGDPMALATIPEITGVNTLKSAVARTASEAGTTAEEATSMAQRAQQEMAALEAMIEQAAALEFGDDGGTLEELAALRDLCAAAVHAAQKLQQAMVDKAALAAQSSKKIHDRHSGISEAVSATGGRMASKTAYTADV